MGTTNPKHRMHKKEVFWRHHLDCWSRTTLTQAHYCRKNGLSQSDFSKWKKKINPKVKNNKRKRPLALEHKDFTRNHMLRLKANRCSFCGTTEKRVNKLFYGENEYVAICDNCLWHKANMLHFELPLYKNIRFEKCSVCFKDKPGVVIGNVYYKVCQECLVDAWTNLYDKYPEMHPCRNACIACNTKNPEQHLRIGGHIICQSCLIAILKRYIKISIDVNKCSFCQAEGSSENPLYGKDIRWICQNCAEAAYESFFPSFKSTKDNQKYCALCGDQKQDGIVFIESEHGCVCSACISESYALIAKDKDVIE